MTTHTTTATSEAQASGQTAAASEAASSTGIAMPATLQPQVSYRLNEAVTTSQAGQLHVVKMAAFPKRSRYSSRSACITSMREARAAGTSEAMTAAPTSTPAASVSGTASGSVTEVK